MGGLRYVLEGEGQLAINNWRNVWITSAVCTSSLLGIRSTAPSVFESLTLSYGSLRSRARSIPRECCVVRESVDGIVGGIEKSTTSGKYVPSSMATEQRRGLVSRGDRSLHGHYHVLLSL